MGFRSGAFATIWEVNPVSDSFTKGRISISKKNRQTGEYEQDFSGFVEFVGTNTANKALSLREKDRIKLGDVDVTTRYDKERNKEYINYKVYSFELPDDNNATQTDATSPHPVVDNGEIDDSDSRLPF